MDLKPFEGSIVNQCLDCQRPYIDVVWQANIHRRDIALWMGRVEIRTPSSYLYRVVECSDGAAGVFPAELQDCLFSADLIEDVGCGNQNEISLVWRLLYRLRHDEDSSEDYVALYCCVRADDFEGAVH